MAVTDDMLCLRDKLQYPGISPGCSVQSSMGKPHQSVLEQLYINGIRIEVELKWN